MIEKLWTIFAVLVLILLILIVLVAIVVIFLAVRKSIRDWKIKRSIGL